MKLQAIPTTLTELSQIPYNLGGPRDYGVMRMGGPRDYGVMKLGGPRDYGVMRMGGPRDYGVMTPCSRKAA